MMAKHNWHVTPAAGGLLDDDSVLYCPVCGTLRKADGSLDGEVCPERWPDDAPASPPVPTAVEPVAWRVKDFADGWVLCRTEDEARRLAEGAGNLVQALYTAAPSSPTAAEVEEVLRPFADFGDYLAVETTGFSDSDELELTTEEGHRLHRFRIGDFRRATSLIERLAGKEVEE